MICVNCNFLSKNVLKVIKFVDAFLNTNLLFQKALLIFPFLFKKKGVSVQS